MDYTLGGITEKFMSFLGRNLDNTLRMDFRSEWAVSIKMINYASESSEARKSILICYILGYERLFKWFQSIYNLIFIILCLKCLFQFKMTRRLLNVYM